MPKNGYSGNNGGKEWKEEMFWSPRKTSLVFQRRVYVWPWMMVAEASLG